MTAFTQQDLVLLRRFLHVFTAYFLVTKARIPLDVNNKALHFSVHKLRHRKQIIRATILLIITTSESGSGRSVIFIYSHVTILFFGVFCFTVSLEFMKVKRLKTGKVCFSEITGNIRQIFDN